MCIFLVLNMTNDWKIYVPVTQYIDFEGSLVILDGLWPNLLYFDDFFSS